MLEICEELEYRIQNEIKNTLIILIHYYISQDNTLVFFESGSAFCFDWFVLFLFPFFFIIEDCLSMQGTPLVLSVAAFVFDSVASSFFGKFPQSPGA